MKIQENINDIETSFTKNKNFTIKASPKAFKILSSGLYSNKIRAVIRELSCNAYDSHIAANNNEPFIVHLPSQLDNTFYVKDFGTGLSEEDIMNLYTTYFDSNKTSSNDFIGALGLGSKSPFSYTDSFIVESIFDNIKSIYLIYLDENEFPSISKIEQEETNEHSGLTVKFSIKENDFDEFINEALYVLSPFENQPKITGGKYNIRLQEPLIFTNDYSLIDNWPYHWYRGLYAFMGNILYPVNLNELNLKDETIQFIKNRKLVIRFNIGDLDITPSREQLSYINSTKNKLIEKINNTIEYIIENTINDINNKSDTFEMATAFNALKDDIRPLIYDRIDRNKFIFDDKLYDSTRDKFYCNLGNISRDDILLNGIKSFKIVELNSRNKSRTLFFTKTNSNLFNMNKDKSFYISFSKEDDDKFKSNLIYSSNLICVRRYRNSTSTCNDIVNYLKNNYFINNILYAKDLTYEEKDDGITLMYTNDMSYCEPNNLKDYINIRNFKQIQFNEYKGFENVYKIENNYRTFLIPCDKCDLLKKDGGKLITTAEESKYYEFIYQIFTKYYPSYKLLFCRKKAIKFIEENFQIPLFFDFAERLLRKQKIIKNRILEMYKEIEGDNVIVEKVSKSMDPTKIEKLTDIRLKNIIMKYRSFNHDRFKNKYAINKENICRLYKNIKINNENISNNDYIKKYNNIFDIVGNLWGSDIKCQTQNIIDLANLIYEKERTNV